MATEAVVRMSRFSGGGRCRGGEVQGDRELGGKGDDIDQANERECGQAVGRGREGGCDGVSMGANEPDLR